MALRDRPSRSRQVGPSAVTFIELSGSEDDDNDPGDTASRSVAPLSPPVPPRRNPGKQERRRR